MAAGDWRQMRLHSVHAEHEINLDRSEARDSNWLAGMRLHYFHKRTLNALNWSKARGKGWMVDEMKVTVFTALNNLCGWKIRGKD